MKGKWVNRNRYPTKQGIVPFTLPLKDASSNKMICATEIDQSRYQLWRDKLIRGLSQAYSKSPHKDEAIEIVAEVLSPDLLLLEEVCHRSIVLVFKYLRLEQDLIRSSSFRNEKLGRTERLIDICKQSSCDHYVNSIGGVSLYREKDFDADGIKLSFLRPRFQRYRQHQLGKVEGFVENMSIIDILMNCSDLDIKSMIYEYDLARG